MNKDTLDSLLDQRTVEVTKENLEEILTQLVSKVKDIPMEDAAQIAKEIIADSTQYISGEYEVHHLNLWQHPVIDDLMITITMTTEEDEDEYDLLSIDGVFGYVYNLDAPYCSELGYSFYREEENVIRRIG
jgi:hypothetical protein